MSAVLPDRSHELSQELSQQQSQHRPQHRPQHRSRNGGHRHWQLGIALSKKGLWAQAAQAFASATQAAPQDGLYWLNLAHAQRRAGDLPMAISAARRAVALDAGDSIALRTLGDCLLEMHDYAEAADAFAQLDARCIASNDAHINTDIEAMLQHAMALQALQRHGPAAEVLLRALSVKPDLVRAHALLADSCRDQGLKREAVECMKTVLALDPGNLEAMSHLSYEKRHLCDWADLQDDVERITETLQTAPAGLARVAAVFGLLSLPLEPALHLVAARGEAQVHACGVLPLPAVQPVQLAGSKPRLGFLSYDFREHPVAQLLVEVLEAVDRSRFDIALYSCGPDDGSPLRARLAAAASAFVDLRGLSDQHAAERIRADGVDVLVDLMGHTRGHRMGILARKPAPVQVGYLGYPGSTGADCIDYIVGDPLVTPVALAPQYSEQLAQLPLCFQPNGRGRPVPGHGAARMTRAQAGLPEGAFVLCAFNHTYKIGPDAFDSWCAVLRAVPHAVLWLKETNAQLHSNVLREAAARGVDAGRVIFAPTLGYTAHFARLALADVFVDTWPYNAHTTAADALWAGVPVVTLYGNCYASRVAASVLNAAGMAELACADEAAYRDAITVLAQNPDLLAGYKAHLVDKRLALPLFDTPRYAAELQDLFGRMVDRWRSGQAAEHLLAIDDVAMAKHTRLDV